MGKQKASNHTDHNSLGHFATRISVAAIPSQHIPGRPTAQQKQQQRNSKKEHQDKINNSFAEEQEEEVDQTQKKTISKIKIAAPSTRKSQKSRMQALLESQLDEEFQKEEEQQKISEEKILGKKSVARNPSKFTRKKSEFHESKKTQEKAPEKPKINQARVSGSKTVQVKSSSHKNHSIEQRSTRSTNHGGSPFGGKNLKVHTSEIRLTDKKGRKYTADRSKMSHASNQLQHGQIIAFWNAFMLFDHYETGVISASELSTTLNHLGLHTNEKELQAIIDAHDDNGNGALDFEEYLNLMTDPSIFQAMMHSGRPEKVEQHNSSNRPTTFHTPNKPDYRDCLMYEVMNEFFNCKSLGADQEREIVGFYAKTLKHIHSHKPHQQHAAHVVHHYADGARSLGLTEKEIKEEIDKIREKQRCEKNEKKRNSPYANPMRMIPRMDKSIEYKKKYNVMSRNNIKEGHLIWRGTPIVNYQVKLPRLEVKCSKTFENLKKIRHKAHDKNNQYRIGLSDVQKTNNKKLWSMLRYQHIPCERLKDVLKEVYGAYTAHVTMQPLDSKPRYVAYSIHDFKSVFPDILSEDDSDDEEQNTLEQKRSTIHELSRQKLMMALKK